MSQYSSRLSHVWEISLRVRTWSSTWIRFFVRSNETNFLPSPGVMMMAAAAAGACGDGDGGLLVLDDDDDGNGEAYDRGTMTVNEEMEKVWRSERKIVVVESHSAMNRKSLRCA
jgi:hypothetical protein